MTLEKGEIVLRNLRFHAFHGVLEQERTVGNDYVVSVIMQVPLADAVRSDRVEDTVNYADVYDLVRCEMMKPSALMEHVAGRMAAALETAFPQIESVRISITKVNPPMGADCDGAAVELGFRR